MCLKAALALSPDNYPLIMYYARAQIATGHPEEGPGQLEAVPSEREDDLYVWQLLSDAYYANSKNPLGVLRSRAEAYYLTGDDRRAVEQWRIAADSVKDNSPLYAKILGRTREMQEAKEATKRS